MSNDVTLALAARATASAAAPELLIVLPAEGGRDWVHFQHCFDQRPSQLTSMFVIFLFFAIAIASADAPASETLLSVRRSNTTAHESNTASSLFNINDVIDAFALNILALADTPASPI